MIELKELKSDQAYEMAALYTQCFEDSWEASFFKGKLEESCFATGAFLKNDLVGFIFVQLVEDEAEILTFCVGKNNRKQGVGGALLRSILKQSKIMSCFLEVHSQNKVAISLYERLGFVKRGFRKGYYQGEHQKSQNAFQDAIIYGYSKKMVYL